MPGNNSEFGQGEFGSTEFGANQTGGSGGSGSGSGFGAGEFGATEFGNTGSVAHVVTVSITVASTTSGIRDVLKVMAALSSTHMGTVRIVSRVVSYAVTSNIVVLRIWFTAVPVSVASIVGSIRDVLRSYAMTCSSTASALAFKIKVVAISVAVNSTLALSRFLELNEKVVSGTSLGVTRFTSIARSVGQPSVIGAIRLVTKPLAFVCHGVLNLLDRLITFILPTPFSRQYRVRREQRSWIDPGF